QVCASPCIPSSRALIPYTTLFRSVRVPREHVAGQQPAVGAAAHGEVVAVGDPAVEEVPGDRGEVLVGAVAVLLQRRLVPAGPVLAAAADVGQHVGAAALEPGLADR